MVSEEGTLRVIKNTDSCTEKKLRGAFSILKSCTHSKLSLFLVAFLYIFLFSSCSNKASSTAIFSEFDTIDSFIQHNQNKDALKELKKLEKKVYDINSIIGIYKRYQILGEDKFSETLLKDALKKNSENLDLRVLYSVFLLDRERFSEAEKVSEKLKNTKYASVYSESVIKNQDELFQNGEPSSLYKNENYYSIFWDSYNATKNPVWIRNCAAFYLTTGNYQKAANLTPGFYSDADDAYFWAIVNFDGGNYMDCIDTCEECRKFMKSMAQSSTKNTSDIRLQALISDSYAAMDEESLASKARDKIIETYINEKTLENVGQIVDGHILPVVCVNAAVSLLNQGEQDKACDLLFYTVRYFPQFVPGLLEYADFAWNSSQERVEDAEVKALRKSGIYSLEMEKYDARRKVPVSDAIYRIDSALENNTNSRLYLKKLDLRYKMDTSLTVKDKTADLWRMLESTSSETLPYHDDLAQYAVVFFLNTKQPDAAEELFYKYMLSKYSLNLENFFEQISENVQFINIKDLELASWFALDRKKTQEALRIMEFCVFESSGVSHDKISPLVSSQTSMNLANFYFSTGKKEKALDLYGKTASSETDKKLRSEIFYRIACIYSGAGETKNALRAADYAVNINPQNAKAHLLKTKLK